jgi:FlaA1/EpsC-like NDP-sugar epimerase
VPGLTHRSSPATPLHPTHPQIHEAITTLRSGGVIGKVVLSTRDVATGAPLQVQATRLPAGVRLDGVHLITGGAGGFGSVIVRGLYERGVRHFVITVTSRPER